MRKVFIEMEKLKNLNSGLGQFCLNLGQELSKLPLEDIELTFFLPRNFHNIWNTNIKHLTNSFPYTFFPIRKKFDVWHCIHQDSKFLPTKKETRLILTIHDLNFLEKYKSSRKINSYLKNLQRKVNKASAITVISDYTASIVKEHLKVPSIPFKVIYNGNSLKMFEKVRRPYFAPEEDFIFSIGIINPKKNFHVLLELLAKTEDIKLILAGDRGSAYANYIIKRAEELGVKDRLILPGIINDESKYWLYRNCKAFVFPSLSEGFGLPMIEAMSVGKPTFLSTTTSLPEIGGREAFYWKNFEPSYMAEVFKKGLIDFYADKEKPQRLIQWAQKFSWKEAIKEYIKLYKEL